MNREELNEIRKGYWGRPGSNREKKFQLLFAHIDEQAKEIETLKAALIEERAQKLISCPSCGRGGTYIDESITFIRNWQNNDIKIEYYCKNCDNRWVDVYTLTRYKGKL